MPAPFPPSTASVWPGLHAHADAGERNALAVPPLEGVELDRRHGREAYARAVVARLVGINHVVLEVGELAEGLDFYGRIFEFELRGRVRGMAFLDMGDQFLVLAEGREQPPDEKRHFGLVVDDRVEVRRRLEAEGAEILPGRGLDFRDPWGNHVQVVEYGDVQFSKTHGVLRGMDSPAGEVRGRAGRAAQKGLARE